MKKILLFTIIGLFGCISCKRSEPTPYRGMPKEYTTAYEEVYGHCYDSIPYAVVMLDLYSEGLSLNEQHKIKGTGYNLCLTDIFVPDSLLAEGTYHSDTSATPYSFLPGRDYEGMPHGIYLLNIEEDKVINIQVLDSGSFVYHGDSLIFTLYYRNVNGGKSTYETRFVGPLIPIKK